MIASPFKNLVYVKPYDPAKYNQKPLDQENIIRFNRYINKELMRLDSDKVDWVSVSSKSGIRKLSWMKISTY
jgi:hypothetical protein